MIKTLLHLMACYLMADVIYNFIPKKMGRDEYWGPLIPVLIATAAACIVGMGKEFFDLWQGEAFSAGDITMDVSGAFAWLFVMKIGEVLPWRR
jgi:hypothetical protein